MSTNEKAIVLLASAGGSGAYAIKFTQEANYVFGIVLGFIFCF